VKSFRSVDRRPPQASAPRVARRRRGRPKVEGLGERRREEILCAAAAVFAAQGFRNTDVQAVADALGLAKGTVYSYFPSKRGLFLAAVDRGMRLLRVAVDAAVAEADDPLDRVARGIKTYLAFFDAHPELVELFIQERAEFRERKRPTYFEHRDANIGRWKRLFRDLIRSGRVRRVPVARITDVISDLLYGTMFTNFFAGRRKSFERQAQDILDVVFLGILCEGGSKVQRGWTLRPPRVAPLPDGR
jgi:AcrR family transcriptional regulator